jgi:hypothetical protein
MKKLGDRELLEAWMGFFGVTTGLRLLGWCAVTGLRLPEGATERDLLTLGQGVQSSRYANVARLKAFARFMAERGELVGHESDDAWRVVGLVRAA